MRSNLCWRAGQSIPEITDCRFAECMQSKQCAGYKHHYDECAERVQKQEEEGGKAEEDCVEECAS